jgi:hypothetical protein
MLADAPEEALAWAAKSIRDKCPDAFAPAPAVVKKGIEKYLELKAERGAKFRVDHVFPEWAPSTSRERLSAWMAQKEEDERAGRVTTANEEK